MAKQTIKLISIVLAAVIAISAILLIQNSMQSFDSNENLSQSPTEVSQSQLEELTWQNLKKAAIIDQLHDSIPNIDFQNQTTEYLELAGYKVELFTTEDIDVDFYKKLPSMKHDFIVIRTHGSQDEYNNNATMLFTGERYDKTKYTREQLYNQILPGSPVTLSSPPTDSEASKKIQESIQKNLYFVVGSKMVDDLMIDTFPDSIILIGGCSTFNNPDLANSLIQRGAKNVIGWDATISSSDNDKLMLEFLGMVLVNKTDIVEASEIIDSKHFENMGYPAHLTVGMRAS